MSIHDRLEKVSFVDVKPDLSQLSAPERQALAHCVGASAVLSNLYLAQVSKGNLARFNEWQAFQDDSSRAIARYYRVMGSPWDVYGDKKSFVPGVSDEPEVISCYPAGFTKEEYDSWIKEHPSQKEAFESPVTAIERQDLGLKAVPYSQVFSDQLEEASRSLEEAAEYLQDGSLKDFLVKRAEAFRTNEYRESELAWLDTNGQPFEVTIGPYETYFDATLGLKAAFESFVSLPDKETTATLERFKPYVAMFEEKLANDMGLQRRPDNNPMVVVRDVIRGGEAGFNSLVLAYNLPNDRSIHAEKGSKRVFSRTFMDMSFEMSDSIIADTILLPEQAERCSAYGQLLFVLGHELSHGLGPGSKKANGESLTFMQTLGDLHNVIEEAKADTVGLELLQYFVTQDLLSQSEVDGATIGVLVSCFRRWGRGFHAPHSRGNLLEYNWLKAHQAFTLDTTNNRYSIDVPKAHASLVALGRELMNLQLSGDYQQAKQFIDTWSDIPEEAVRVSEGITGLPDMVCPQWDLSDLEPELIKAGVVLPDWMQKQ